MIVLTKFIKQIKEEATGTRDGINKTFTSSNNFKDGSLVVLYNGQDMTLDIDFVVLGSNSFSFVYIAPKPDDVLKINYIKE